MVARGGKRRGPWRLGPRGGAWGAEVSAQLRKMRDLRKRAADISAAEAGFCRQARARLEHLCEAEAALARHGPPGAPGASARGRSGEGSTLVEANERSLEFMLADHVLRAGHLDTARLAAAEGRLEDLVDLEIFSQARGVTEALRGGSCREALAWCAEHAARLRRAGSRLEFRVRKKEFLELVRRGQAAAALTHARKELVPLLDGSPETRGEFQQAMATLVFGRPGGPGGGSGAGGHGRPGGSALHGRPRVHVRADRPGHRERSPHQLPPGRLLAGGAALNRLSCHYQAHRRAPGDAPRVLTARLLPRGIEARARALCHPLSVSSSPLEDISTTLKGHYLSLLEEALPNPCARA